FGIPDCPNGVRGSHLARGAGLDALRRGEIPRPGEHQPRRQSGPGHDPAMKAAEKIGTRMQVRLIEEEKVCQAPAYQPERVISWMWSIRLRTGIRSPTEGYAMLKEYHYDHLRKVSPTRKRCPCVLPVQFRRSAGAFTRTRSGE